MKRRADPEVPLPAKSPPNPVQSAREDPPPVRSRPGAVLAALSTTVFLVPFMVSSLNLALPLLVAEFKLDTLRLAAVLSSYLLASAIGQMPAARAADLLGRRRVYLAGLTVFLVFSLACAFAGSGESLIVFRFFCGLGSAMVFGTYMAILGSVFTPAALGRALGINTAVVYAAIAAGPLLGGLLAHYWGWRSIFFAVFGLGLAGLVASACFIRDEWVEARGESFDYPGAVTYALAVGGWVGGCSLLPDWTGAALLAVGILAGVLFVARQRKAEHPLLPLGLFLDNRPFRLGAISAMINYASSFAITFLLSLYLQYVRGLDARSAGLLLMAQPVVQTLFSPAAGRWSDRVNPTWLASSGMGLIAAGLFALAWVTPTTPLPFLLAALGGIGLGFALFSAPNTNFLMGAAGRKSYGTASATIGTARLIGQALSIALATMILHRYLGDAPLTAEAAPEYLRAMRTAMLAFSALCAVGVHTSLAKLSDVPDSRADISAA